LSLFEELKRRNVIRVTVAYVVVAWLLAQVLELVFESFGTPDWVMKTVLVLLAAGLALTVFFAWAFELTPEGLKREKEVDREQSITAQTGQKLNRLIITLMAIALAYFAWDKFILHGSPGPSAPESALQPGTPSAEETAAEPEKSIAVLPFVDMSPQKDQDYFTDGLTENLLNALAKLKDLKVAGRTSSFAFKNKNEDLRSIGDQLGVAHVLEGSVQKSGERVRITAQLINAVDGYHLWSETYDRTLDDIFAVQDEIAGEVARAMQVALLGNRTGTQVVTSHNSGAAYNLYLKGLYERNRGTLESNQRAIEYFNSALELDPGMALAWAGLSSAQEYVTGFVDTDFRTGFEEARANALRALEIDPNLPEGHLALGEIQQSLDWDWAAAEASFSRAVELRPGDTEFKRSLAQIKELRGKRDEALAEFRRAAEQDPLNWPAQAGLAVALTSRHQFDQAILIFDRLQEMEPDRPVIHWQRGRLRMFQQDYEAALEEFSQERFEFLKLTGQAIALHHLGRREQAVATLQNLIATMGESSSYQIAEVYAQWGDTDNAMSWLERGYNIRDPGLQYLGNDRLFEPIAEDPRFQAFLQKMNFGG